MSATRIQSVFNARAVAMGAFVPTTNGQLPG